MDSLENRLVEFIDLTSHGFFSRLVKPTEETVALPTGFEYVLFHFQLLTQTLTSPNNYCRAVTTAATTGINEFADNGTKKNVIPRHNLYTNCIDEANQAPWRRAADISGPFSAVMKGKHCRNRHIIHHATAVRYITHPRMNFICTAKKECSCPGVQRKEINIKQQDGVQQQRPLVLQVVLN